MLSNAKLSSFSQPMNSLRLTMKYIVPKEIMFRGFEISVMSAFFICSRT